MRLIVQNARSLRLSEAPLTMQPQQQPQGEQKPSLLKLSSQSAHTILERMNEDAGT
jgi:hypothetical protein